MDVKESRESRMSPAQWAGPETVGRGIQDAYWDLRGLCPQGVGEVMGSPCKSHERIPSKDKIRTELNSVDV